MEPQYTLIYSDGEFVKFHPGSGEAWVLSEDDDDKPIWVKVEEKK